MSAQLPQPSPAASASASASASQPGWIRRDYDFIKTTAENDSAFRLSLVGMSLYFLSMIVIAVTLALTIKNTTFLFSLIFSLVLAAIFVGFSLWNNYCLVYGKCKYLAFGFGVFYLILGIAEVGVAVAIAFNAKKYGAAFRQILNNK